MNRRYGKGLRLRSQRDFQQLQKASRRVKGQYLCLDIGLARQGVSRLGISASRKFGSSPERSRFKRIVREAFRLSRQAWAPLDLHVVPRQMAKTASSKDIQSELLRLLTHGA